MQGGALPYRRRVRLQLRASNMRAPYGLTYWSDPVQLDSLGGAAVVSVPCPSAAPSSALHNPRATYMLSIMANQARNPPALAGLRFCIDAVHVKLRLILDITVSLKSKDPNCHSHYAIRNRCFMLVTDLAIIPTEMHCM